MKRLLLRGVWILAVVAGVYALQMANGNLQNSYQDMLLQAGVAIILAVSLNIVNGFTGQFSIGHAGFMALGAYGSIVVTYYVGYSIFGDVMKHENAAGYGLYFVSILVGGSVAALAGWIVGLPSLRLRGDYLAIVTLGFGEIIRVLLQATEPTLYPSELKDVHGAAR